jgi:hypothetical protein
MMNWGRMAAITTVALGLGFVGGAWFIGSGVAFQFIPVPNVAPVSAGPNARPSPPRPARPIPLVKAVSVPTPANFSSGSGGLGPRADRIDLMPAPGCTWAVEPRPFRLGGLWHLTDPERALGGYSAVDPDGAGLRYLLIQSTRQGGAAVELRPVFFDAEGNRHVPLPMGGGTSRSPGGVFDSREFVLSTVHHPTPAKVAYFGIEWVAPDSARLLVDSAQREAKEKGLSILPPLRFGQPYPFDLPTADGKRVRSDDLRGKPVLLVVVGPGASTTLGLMYVKKVREANPKDELAVVGVSFDGSIGDARDAFAWSGSNDPLVVVPNDPTSRRIWTDGAQLAHLPMFILLDREGVLRLTPRSFDLQDHVDILFGRAKRRPLPTPVRGVRPAPKAPTPGPTAPTSTPESSTPPRPGL